MVQQLFTLGLGNIELLGCMWQCLLQLWNHEDIYIYIYIGLKENPLPLHIIAGALTSSTSGSSLQVWI